MCKGAFTGAVQDTVGKVALAEGGTLFLDEIGDLPPALQPKLLRLLQEKQYERVGETRTRACDVRILAATNRDLEAAVAAGTFRDGSALSAERHRGGHCRRCGSGPRDILPLADHLLQFFARQAGKAIAGFTEEAQRRLADAIPGPAMSASCATPSNAA